MVKKSNEKLVFIKDRKKSYVYIKDGNKHIGMLAWNFLKKVWIFENWQGKTKQKIIIKN